MTDGYKIKRVLTWVNNEEKQIYPADHSWKPGANTVAYYPLQKDTNDYSGNSRNLTNSGVTFSDNGYGLPVGYFNGSSYASLTGSSAYIINNGKNYTLSIWVKTSNGYVGSYVWIADIRGGNRNYAFSFHQNGAYYKGQISFGTESSPNMVSASPHNWINLIETYNNGTSKFYVNGALVTSGSAGTTSFVSADIKIGGYVGGGYGFWGYISNIIFENKDWSADEVLEYYNLTKSKYSL